MVGGVNWINSFNNRENQKKNQSGQNIPFSSRWNSFEVSLIITLLMKRFFTQGWVVKKQLWTSNLCFRPPRMFPLALVYEDWF